MQYAIRPLRADEYPLLNDFLYEAIFIPEGAQPPPREIINSPQLQVYVSAFGTHPCDLALAAESGGRVVGVVWARIMDDYGHIDNDTPSLAISLYAPFRGAGIGTALLRAMLRLLKDRGFARTSLSVQKNNRAVHMYQAAGFKVFAENDSEYIMLIHL